MENLEIKGCSVIYLLDLIYMYIGIIGFDLYMIYVLVKLIWRLVDWLDFVLFSVFLYLYIYKTHILNLFPKCNKRHKKKKKTFLPKSALYLVSIKNSFFYKTLKMFQFTCFYL